MRIRLLAVGAKMPAWVAQGIEEYRKRLPAQLLNIQPIPLGKRTKGSSVQRAVDREGQVMLAALSATDTVIALDVAGQAWSTEQLAQYYQQWQFSGHTVSLLIGGPDGLAPACLDRAQQRWSLSALTLPHSLVRIMVVEQMYRAWAIACRHPYHR